MNVHSDPLRPANLSPSTTALCSQTIRRLSATVASTLLCTALAGPVAAQVANAGVPAVRTSSVSLPADTEVDGIRVSELSGLAWDAGSQTLYAVADSGSLFRFRLRIEGGALRAVEPLGAVALQRPEQDGKPRPLDAEGLSLRRAGSATELLVATEGRPTVWRVAPSGELLGEMALPPALADPARYSKRNTMLEAVAVHPRHGLLLSPEQPLQGEDPALGHRIRANDREWQIEALDPGSSRLKAMDITEGGNLLVLERNGSGKRLSNAVRLADLSRCDGPAPCPLRSLAHFDADSGAENFEGMTPLGPGQALLVSDNSGGKKPRATVFMLLQWEEAANPTGR